MKKTDQRLPSKPEDGGGEELLRNIWPIPNASDPEHWRKVLKNPKKHGYSADKARWLADFFLNPRQPLTPEEQKEAVRGWYDDACHWFSLADLDPHRAAMLLCQFNPNEVTLDYAEKADNDETGPADFVQLKQRFEDLSRTVPRFRSLLDWLHAAREMKLRYHSWIDRYIEAVGRIGPPLTPTPSPVILAMEVKLPGITKRERQIRAILEEIERLKFNPMKIPLRAKTRIGTACGENHKGIFVGSTSFAEAWKDASAAGRLAITGKDRFTRKKVG